MARDLPQEQHPKAHVCPPPVQFPDCGPQARDSTKQPSVFPLTPIYTCTYNLSHTNKYKPNRLVLSEELSSSSPHSGDDSDAFSYPMWRLKNYNYNSSSRTSTSFLFSSSSSSPHNGNGSEHQAEWRCKYLHYNIKAWNVFLTWMGHEALTRTRACDGGACRRLRLRRTQSLQEDDLGYFTHGGVFDENENMFRNGGDGAHFKKKKSMSARE